jgi:ClpP class serine protease
MPNWTEVLKEITEYKTEHTRQAQAAVDAVRRMYLDRLFQHTGRNTIAYYSGFLSKPNLEGIEINDEDKNGFMMAVHGLDRSRGLDLILHTPGGGIAATQSLVDYLRRMFEKNIRAIIPQIAMSAGTMMACACRELLLTRHANIGPIDPQLRGVPAHGVIQEFRRAAKEIKKDFTKLGVWQPILSKYQPTFLSQCENAIKWSESFVASELKKSCLKATTMLQIRPKK